MSDFKDPLLLISALIFVVLAALNLPTLPHLYGAVHWETILTLSGLLIITSAMDKSGFFTRLSYRLVSGVHTERALAIRLVVLSILFSPFLTNDITLFVLVPLTLNFKKFMENDIVKLIIFEALGVNVGSFLTPIGNPQNIYLWHHWNISFLKFIQHTLPSQISLSLLLILFTLLAFPSDRKIQRKGEGENWEVKTGMLVFSVIVLIAFTAAVELNFTLYAVTLVVLLYLAFFPGIMRKVNWSIIIILIFLFVDARLLYLTLKPYLQPLFRLTSTPTGTYLASLLLSQTISNVPAAIFLAPLTPFKKALVIGVNVGGNGTIIASLANIIALRLGKVRGWFRFHYYSITFLLFSSILFCSCF